MYFCQPKVRYFLNRVSSNNKYPTPISPHQTSKLFILPHLTHFLSQYINPITELFFTSNLTPIPPTTYSHLKLFPNSRHANYSLLFSQSHFTAVSRSVSLGIEYPCETCDQILFPVGMLLSEICGLVSVWCPLWREDGSAICSVITQWSESLRTRNHILLSHLRLPQPESRVRVAFGIKPILGLLTRNLFSSEV
jgi:hypothetical protein